MKCIETILHMCTLNSHLPTLLLYAVNIPHLHTSAGPAPVVWSIGLLFLVLSVHRLWIAELAAILGGVTLSFFLPFLWGSSRMGKKKIQSAFTFLKILEPSYDRIQQIVIKYKPEPELPLSSVSLSTKLSGI